MKRIRFWKMSGSGNDFLIVDRRNQSLVPDPVRFARCVCRPKVSVGADGVLFLEESQQADFAMRIFNADGSEAEMCGNGARCIARYAHLRRIAGSKMTIETRAGLVEAEVKGARVKVRLGDPKGLALHTRIVVEGEELTVHRIDTGVPHAVLFLPHLDSVPVRELGSKIRFHPAFGPAGTNVDFAQARDRHRLDLRTYERGVEDETLACGTGAVAAALVSAALGFSDSPAQVHTRGGEVITVHFRKKESLFEEVYLEGNTIVAFEGELWEEALA